MGSPWQSTASRSAPAAADALTRFRRAFPEVQVTVAAGAAGFGLDYREVRMKHFAVSRMRCTGGLRALGPLSDVVALGHRTAGTVTITHDGRRVDTSRPYLRPTGPAELEVHDATVMLIALQPEAVEEYLARSGAHGAPVNRLGTAPHLVALGLAMAYAGTFLDEPDALTPAVAEELEDLLCFSLLHAFTDPWEETGRGEIRSSVLRRALRHMEEHAGEAVTMPAVAEAARISVRSLGLLFRRELDTTPLGWLRDLRLDRARLDLLAGAGTVAEIAARHGLPAGGHFAAQYRARFDEQPADTLHGAPPRRRTADRVRYAAALERSDRLR